MTNEGAEQEYEVLIRCTHNDKKFAARVSPSFFNSHASKQDGQG